MHFNVSKIALAAATAKMALETTVPSVMLGKSEVKCTRILHGLWQTSGGWGQIVPQEAVAMMKNVWQKGYTTFDLADHYGPAEDLIGMLRNSMSPAERAQLQAYTKWVPQPGPMTKAKVDAAINKSLQRMQTDKLDLLQFHWWDYGMQKELMDGMHALHDLVKAGKIRALALTNFDTDHVRMFMEAGLPIASNQVQFSLVDMRPAQKMAPYCSKAGVSLLTYGTLCGGLLSDSWLGKPEPRSKADIPTPSQGKYYNMIFQWGGWGLFQELLRACRTVADGHGSGPDGQKYTVSNVAVKWILDQPAVAGVIVGLRAGITEHSDDNARACALNFTAGDKELINSVLRKSNDLMAKIGDCGDEYRG